MTTISDSDRDEAQAIAEVFYGCAISALSDISVRRWLAVRDHVLTAHECPTVPVWRPTTRDEIQPGWEIRARRSDGSEAGWGIAHHQDDDGDWRTEAKTILTFADLGWTYETTTPLPEPEPDPRVAVVLEWADDQGDDINAESLLARLDALAARGYPDTTVSESPCAECERLRGVVHTLGWIADDLDRTAAMIHQHAREIRQAREDRP